MEDTDERIMDLETTYEVRFENEFRREEFILETMAAFGKVMPKSARADGASFCVCVSVFAGVCVCLSFCLSVCLPVCLSVCLCAPARLWCVCVCLFMSMSVSVSVSVWV